MSVRRLGFLLVALLLAVLPAAAAPLRIGILTDVHAHDANSPNQHAVMVNYAERLNAFVDAMNAWPADAVVELGDFVNGVFAMGAPLVDPARIPVILSAAVDVLAGFSGPKYFVLGNHDVYDLSKPEFLSVVGAPATTWSFDLGGYHLIALDAQCNRAGVDASHVTWMVQGTVPTSELDWLRQDLASTALPTIVFIHQPLDVEFEMEAGGPPVSNRIDVQEALSESGRVIAVFQGHSHENRHTQFDGVHYITFAAMVDSDVPVPPTWGDVTLDPEARTVRVDGSGLQEDIEFTY
jgi:3',5'-cyclic AMP phosphodiesterase CpdA